MSLKINITRDSDRIEIPEHATSGSAGVDLRAFLKEGDVTLKP